MKRIFRIMLIVQEYDWLIIFCLELRVFDYIIFSPLQVQFIWTDNYY